MVTWDPMHEVVPEGAHGNVKIQHLEVNKKDSDFTRLRASIGHAGEYVPEGKYCRMLIDGHVVMSDTQEEKSSNYAVAYAAHGNVLIAGLGLGMILCPILRNPKVRSVTVIEKNPSVVLLVGAGRFPNKEKLTVVNADIFEWEPSKGDKYETVYFDIWQDICTDNLVEVTKLKRKFAKNLNRQDAEAWMGAWKEDYLRRRIRQERRNDTRWAIGGRL